MSKSELTNGNLKQFITYLNSMDLEKINHSNEQMEMNTNNRNVRLQQHVVLLTVMERAEDLIFKNSSIVKIAFCAPYLTASVV